MRISAKTIAFTALLAAVICAVSPWTIPLGPIPLSLASLGVYLAACVLDCKHGVAAVVAYVVIGGVGLPVFSGARGGFGALVGPTGGYIIGYIVLALAEGLIIDFFAKEKRIRLYPVAMVAGTALLYALGTGWYMAQTGVELLPALAVCVLPFLAGDAVKIVAATAVGFPVRRALRKTVLIGREKAESKTENGEEKR